MASLVLWIHILSGTIAIISGFFTLFLPKGRFWHKKLGFIFVIAMLTTSVMISLLGMIYKDLNDFTSGLLLAYLVATAWSALRPKPLLKLEYTFLLVIVFVVICFIFLGFAASKEGADFEHPPMLYFISAAIASIGLTTDLIYMYFSKRTFRQRLLRHLWRMLLALFMASGSLFLGQMKIFPIWLQENLFWIFFIPPLVCLIAIPIWLCVVKFNTRLSFQI